MGKKSSKKADGSITKSITAETKKKPQKTTKSRTSAPNVDKKSLNTLKSEKEIEFKEENVNSPVEKNFAKLLSPEDRKKMKRNLDKTLEFLKQIGIVDLKTDEERFIITIPFEYEDFTFLSHVIISSEWILIKTSIFELEKLAKDSAFDLLIECLKGNFVLNGVVYSLDPELKSIWAQADIHSSADFNTFKISYLSIIFAIDFFIKNVSPKLELQLKSTLDKETLKDTSSMLYI